MKKLEVPTQECQRLLFGIIVATQLGGCGGAKLIVPFEFTHAVNDQVVSTTIDHRQGEIEFVGLGLSRPAVVEADVYVDGEYVATLSPASPPYLLKVEDDGLHVIEAKVFEIRRGVGRLYAGRLTERLDVSIFERRTSSVPGAWWRKVFYARRARY